MNRTELRRMKKAELIKLAKKNDIRVSSSMLKDEIVDKVHKGLSGKKAGAKSKTKGKAGAKAKTKTKAKAKKKAGPKAKAKTAAGAKRKPAAKKKALPKAKAKRKVRKGKRRPSAAEIRRETGREIGAEELTIRQRAVAGKYELTSGPVAMPPIESMAIPDTYGETRIVAMPRDPSWMFAYWEITAESFREVEAELGEEWTSASLALRVYRGGGEELFDIFLRPESRNWYINVEPGHAYQVAVGVLTAAGRFITIAESNVVEMPRGRVSDNVDERWVVPEESYEKIFAASGGYDMGAGASAAGRRILEMGLEGEMGSGAVSSFGSEAAPPKRPRERGFRLRVATELILYGATEPDARVTIRGKEIKLRGDGTFTARFALPDGKIEIPVTAVSGDEAEERTIETDVRKRSDEKEPVIR